MNYYFNERWSESQEKNAACGSHINSVFWMIFRVVLAFQILMKLIVHNDEMSQTVLPRQSNKYMQSLWKLANFIKSIH